jgi:lysophospholipase L1-like esterase
VAVLATTLVAGLLVQPTPTQAAAAPPLRILLEGDSITQGFDGDFTWRYRFDKELVRQHVSADLVGSVHGPFVKQGYRTSQYADPHFDGDHFARVSSTLGQHAEEVGDEVRSQDPDVIVLEGGVNDLRNGVTPADAEARLRAWINNARAAKPSVRIIISSILDATDLNRPWLPARIRDFRQRQAAVVKDMQAAGYAVSLADTDRGWSVPAYTYDNLHPTPTGETLIAQRISEEFHRLGYLPQAPALFRRTEWSRVARVTARAAARRVTLTWDAQALTGIHVWMRRVGHKARILSGVRTGGSYTTPRLVKGARYQFRIQMIRARESTPYGPITTVRVPRTQAPPAVSQVRVTATGIAWTKSPGATRYGVTYRRGTAKPVVKRVRGLSLAVTGVTVAAVRAMNKHGKSAPRTARP